MLLENGADVNVVQEGMLTVLQKAAREGRVDVAKVLIQNGACGSNISCDVTYCAANQYVSNDACIACAAGTTNDVGDDASGSDTTSTYKRVSNERVSNNACMS